MMRIKDPKFLRSDTVKQKLLALETEDVEDDLDEMGRSRCEEGLVKKPKGNPSHIRKPSSRKQHI